MRILLVSHQLDYSGAPLALVRLAEELLRRGHAVDLCSLNDGPLRVVFGGLGIRYRRLTWLILRRYDLVIANTVVTVPQALRAAGAASRVLAWIHEEQAFFEIANVRPEDFKLADLQFVAFPARFQHAQLVQIMPRARSWHLPNCVETAGSGDNESDEPYFVCSGYWQPRKNQAGLIDLFARSGLRDKVMFVGGNVPEEVRSTGHIIAGSVSHEESVNLIGRSRGLISASLSEVQPLSAIEAMLCGRPVLLSDIEAHRELKSLVPDIVLFETSRLDSFLNGVSVLKSQWNDTALRSRLRMSATTAFGREAFSKAVDSILAQLGR